VSFHYRAAFAATDPTLAYLMRATKRFLMEDHEGIWRSEYIARAIAAHILERHCVLGVKESASAGVLLSPSQLRKVDELFRNSLTSHFTFGELAASAGLSRTTFSALYADVGPNAEPVSPEPSGGTGRAAT
jgi:hypothetical protein